MKGFAPLVPFALLPPVLTLSLSIPVTVLQQSKSTEFKLRVTSPSFYFIIDCNFKKEMYNGWSAELFITKLFPNWRE